MPKINVEKPFHFSPDGKSVIEVEAGEQDVSDRCAEVAVDHLKVAARVEEKSGAGQKGKASKAPQKSKEAAPATDDESSETAAATAGQEDNASQSE